MFSDPGFDNPLNPGARERPNRSRYDVDWGDGRDAVTGQAVADTNGSPGVDSTGTFDGSHTYADDGIYTVTVTIADDDMAGNFASGVAGIDSSKRRSPSRSPTSPRRSRARQTSWSTKAPLSRSRASASASTDPGFDNPHNPHDAAAAAIRCRETFRGFTINWGDGTADHCPCRSTT